jgi:hypothetical protein
MNSGSGNTNTFRVPTNGNAPKVQRLQPIPQNTATPPSAAPPRVRLDRIVSAQPGVRGQVMGANQTPRSRAEVVFVRADRSGSRKEVTADERGQFQANLPGGGWLVYFRGNDGKLVFNSRLDVRDQEARLVTLVSR